jgi:hypothetical protein
MTKYPTKQFFDKYMIILQIVLLFFVSPVMALQSPTHKAINEHIANKNLTFNGFSLHDYLQRQLGMQEGVETYFAKDNANQQVFQWIRDGAGSEDSSVRFLNHFHNPLTDKGLDLWVWGTSVKSAVDWVMMLAGTQGIAGNYSWKDARLYYFWALAADSGNMRKHYFAETFRGLGQLMHLVEDLSSPAHTRDDQHLFLEGYESWAGGPNTPSINSYAGPIFFQPDDTFPVIVRNLFDTDQYTNTNPNPAVTLNGNIGLSEYTNANFFSDDTMDSNEFPSPRTDSTKIMKVDHASPYGAYRRDYFYKECSESSCSKTKAFNQLNTGSYLLSAVDYYDYWRRDILNPGGIDMPVIPTLDENVYGDYAQLLIPRAIGYSSQLLGYFFRGQLEVEEMPVFDDWNEKLQKLYVTVRNVTPTQETMKGDGQSGCLMLSWHYAPSDGSGEIWGRYPYCVYLPNDLPYGKDGSGSEIDDEAHQVSIMFDNLDQIQNAPIWKKDYQRVEFTIAYIGTLGNETMIPSGIPGTINISGAVIGKHFRPASSIVFAEEWLTSPKGDNLVWYMSRDVSGGMADPTFCNDHNCPANGMICDGSCPIPCTDTAGKATDIDPAAGGNLVMNNIRHAKPNCDPSTGSSPAHCNVSLIGYHNLSGDAYNPYNSSAGRSVFPIDITKDSQIQISVDEMSISPVPPATGYATAYQAVEFYFSHGYVLQYSVGDQFLYNPSPYVGYFYLDPGYINADNIYELFALYGFPTPPPDLKLNNIRIVQQTFPNLPCNIGYTQTMKVDLIRIGETKPFH